MWNGESELELIVNYLVNNSEYIKSKVQSMSDSFGVPPETISTEIIDAVVGLISTDIGVSYEDAACLISFNLIRECTGL